MNETIQQIEAWKIALFFAFSMLASWQIGVWIGSKAKKPPQDVEGKFIDVSLAILGLLLAFTFSMALEKHEQRRQAVLDQSTAIGDFYTCATLLKEPCKSEIQKTIREYSQLRLDFQKRKFAKGDEKLYVKLSQDLGERMTYLVGEAIAAGTPIAVPLTNTFNNVVTKDACMLDSYNARLPWSIVALLFVSSVLPFFLMGEKQRGGPKLFPGMLCLIAIVSMVVYVTLDLNQPRRGLLKVHLESMELLVDSIGK